MSNTVWKILFSNLKIEINFFQICISVHQLWTNYHDDNIKLYGTIFLGKDQDYWEELSLHLSPKFEFYNFVLTFSDAKDPRDHTTVQWTPHTSTGLQLEYHYSRTSFSDLVVALSTIVTMCLSITLPYDLLQSC